MNGEDNEETELSKEDKEVEDGDMGERQSSCKEDELKVDGDDNDVGERGLQERDVLQVQQQQAPGTAIGWERFLHVGSIKVLLVENDDSTRHVVTALLRNCNYEVIEASNGLQAWKILEDLTNHVDLVLTEVVMHGLSGIGLLCKIMVHKTRKNIPVIMMSSHDSMGLVFKCLSKGAVDFLVKPIRKNELKNLWQHVWRRCHSSSGSGSESGTQTQKSIKSKSSEKCGNNSGSNTGEDNESNGLNAGDGSDSGSGTQSSWTKRPIEVDSSPALSPVDQISECPDSTCAQVIHSNAETSANKRVQMTANVKCEEKQPEVNDLVTRQPVNHEVKHENTMENLVKHVGAKQTTPLQTDLGKSSKGYEFPGENPSNKHDVGGIATSDPQTESKGFEASREVTSRLEGNNSGNVEYKETILDVSLKRPRGVQDAGKGVQDDVNILRHSELSAFSRYNASSSAFRTPNGITGSSTVIDSGQEVAGRDMPFITRNRSNENPQCPSLKGLSNDIDMGSTTNKLPTSPLIFLSEATSTVNGLHPSSAFKPVKNDPRCNPQQASGFMPTDMPSTALLGPGGTSHPNGQIHHPNHNHQHSHHHYHHHHHHHHHQNNHFHSYEQLHLMSNDDELPQRKFTADAPHCGSSNVLSRPSEEIPLNYSLNRSASGSNYLSNGHNGSSTAANAGGTNGESDIGLPLQSGSGDANGSGDGNRVDQTRLSQREAAVTKYRQKRKERCFKRKVRYQNRKRLAESRPRVRGQFVRQSGPESSNNDTDE